MSFLQQIIYGLPEGFSQLIIGLVGFYAMFFYSDVLLIDPAVVGVIFFVARIISCITDPGVGTFLDARKPGKSGKFVPYMIFGCIFMGVTITLIFMAPDISMTAKILYVILTYNLYNIAYSFFEVPYGGVLTTLTKDYNEVNRAGSIRSFMGAIGIASIGYCAAVFLDLFDGVNGMVNSYTLTALVFGLGIILSGILVKRFVPERFIPEQDEEEEKVGIQDILRIALSNQPLLIVVAVNFFTNFAWLLRDASTIYFFQYVVNRVDLLALYIAIAGFSQLPIIAVLPRLAARFGSKRVIITGTLISLLGFAALYGGIHGSVVLVIIAAAASGTGWSVFYGLMFGMLANTIEYGEWKNGVRTAGISTSLPLLAFKLAMGLSSLVLGMLLKYGGYIAGAVQSRNAVSAINAGFIFIPAVLAVIWLVVILFYDLDRKYPTIMKELEERRKSVV